MTALSEQQRPRTLTEALRAMPAEELAQLLALRPDLLDPVPEDVAELASRSTTSPSISRAVDELNTWLRTVAEALVRLARPDLSRRSGNDAREEPRHCGCCGSAASRARPALGRG